MTIADKENKLFSGKWFLVAGDCNPEKELPLTTLVNKVIEIATMHANSLGIGYEALIKNNQAWVLTRVAVEMERYPRVNEEFTLTTWVESLNRHFSKRNIEIADAEGNPIGWVRTVWMIIDLSSRGSAGIDAYGNLERCLSDKECPIEEMSRLRLLPDEKKAGEYVFKYADCDVNRHVNTVKYVELLLNQFDLAKYDEYFVSRFEIAFVKESHYGETATLRIDSEDEDDCRLSVDVDGECRCCSRFKFSRRS